MAPPKGAPRKALVGPFHAGGGRASRRWTTRMRLSPFGPLRSVVPSQSRHACIGATKVRAGRPRRATAAVGPAGRLPGLVRCGGRAVHLAPRALRAAHDAGESVHEACTACTPPPAAPKPGAAHARRGRPARTFADTLWQVHACLPLPLAGEGRGEGGACASRRLWQSLRRALTPALSHKWEREKISRERPAAPTLQESCLGCGRGGPWEAARTAGPGAARAARFVI